MEVRSFRVSQIVKLKLKLVNKLITYYQWRF